MLQRQTSGSVICPTCGRLVGVNEQRCFNCGRWNPGMWGYAPLLSKLGRDLGFTQIVLWGCGGLYLVMLLVSGSEAMSARGGLFGMLAPSNLVSVRFGASGLLPVLVDGRWWTVLSAGWLHGGALHILFNMMWVRQLAPAVASFYGVGRLIIIYTVATVSGFAITSAAAMLGVFEIFSGPLSFLRGAPLTVGASAPLFGLFGALIVYGRRAGQRAITQQVTQWAVYLVIFGLLFPGVDNWAHMGGFLGGYVAARWLDPLRQETPTHLLLALACMAATVLSLAASLWVPLSPQLRSLLGG